MSAVNRTLSAFAAPAPAIDRYLLPVGAQQQTCQRPLLLSVERTERRTDGQTDARPFHKPCPAYYADSVNNVENIDRWQVWANMTPKGPFPWEDPVAPNLSFVEPLRVHIPNGISIGCAVLAQLTVVTSRQTHRHTDHATSLRIDRICAHSTKLHLKLHLFFVFWTTM